MQKEETTEIRKKKEAFPSPLFCMILCVLLSPLFKAVPPTNSLKKMSSPGETTVK